MKTVNSFAFAVCMYCVQYKTFLIFNGKDNVQNLMRIECLNSLLNVIRYERHHTGIFDNDRTFGEEEKNYTSNVR